MKEFFKMMFASMVGSILLGVVGIFLFFLALGSLASSMSEKTVEVKPSSVLEIKLNVSIPERTPTGVLEDLQDPDERGSEGLDVILENLDKAAADKNIKGVYLNIGMMEAGQATIGEVRNKILEFRKSGKFVVAYAELLTDKTYYIASAADKVYLNPAGDFLFNGFAANLTFYKGALDKLGVKMEVFRAGKYKSAVEPFTGEGMSEANREQLTFLVKELYREYLQRISESRKIDVKVLQGLADSLSISGPQDALKHKLVDGLKYETEVKDELKTLSGLKADQRLALVNISRYKNVPNPVSKYSKNKIAIVYAIGEIQGGQGDNQTIGSDRIARTISRVRKDPSVKAIVLRINSPGGSSLASDVIAHEVKLAAKEKPVIVSMGDVAASGGYYIASFADTIVAMPQTITGSIGVFGLFPNMQELLNNKLGIRSESVEAAEFADIGRVDRPMSETEKRFIQVRIDKIYDDFIQIVSEGRKLPAEQVMAIAEGRVWPGAESLKIKLTDVQGGLHDAVKIAAKSAGLKEYSVMKYPEMKDLFSQLFSRKKEEDQAVRAALGTFYSDFSMIRSAANARGTMKMMPWSIVID